MIGLLVAHINLGRVARNEDIRSHLRSSAIKAPSLKGIAHLPVLPGTTGTRYLVLACLGGSRM